jgi:hypothetical protein
MLHVMHWLGLFPTEKGKGFLNLLYYIFLFLHNNRPSLPRCSSPSTLASTSEGLYTQRPP